FLPLLPASSPVVCRFQRTIGSRYERNLPARQGPSLSRDSCRISSESLGEYVPTSEAEFFRQMLAQTGCLRVVVSRDKADLIVLRGMAMRDLQNVSLEAFAEVECFSRLTESTREEVVRGPRHPWVRGLRPSTFEQSGGSDEELRIVFFRRTDGCSGRGGGSPIHLPRDLLASVPGRFCSGNLFFHAAQQPATATSTLFLANVRGRRIPP